MLRTFRIGGIHPPENKLSAGKKITALAAPKQVIIPLSQHIGAPAQCTQTGYYPFEPAYWCSGTSRGEKRRHG